MRVPFRRPEFFTRSSLGRPNRGSLLASLFAILTVVMLTAAGTVGNDGDGVEATASPLSPPSDDTATGGGGTEGSTGRALARSIDEDPAAPNVEQESDDPERLDPIAVRDQLALSAVVARAGAGVATPTTTAPPPTTEARRSTVTSAPEPAVVASTSTAPETADAAAAPDTTAAPDAVEATAVETTETTGTKTETTGTKTETTGTETETTGTETETTAPDTTAPPETTATTAAPAGSDGWVDSGNGVLLPRILLAIRRCESHDNYQAANPRSSARGAYQFLTGSWAAYGHKDRYGVSQAHLATNSQQDEAALITWQRDGTRPWNASRSCWG